MNKPTPELPEKIETAVARVEARVEDYDGASDPSLSLLNQARERVFPRLRAALVEHDRAHQTLLRNPPISRATSPGLSDEQVSALNHRHVAVTVNKAATLGTIGGIISTAVDVGIIAEERAADVLAAMREVYGQGG